MRKEKRSTRQERQRNEVIKQERLCQMRKNRVIAGSKRCLSGPPTPQHRSRASRTDASQPPGTILPQEGPGSGAQPNPRPRGGGGPQGTHRERASADAAPAAPPPARTRTTTFAAACMAGWRWRLPGPPPRRSCRPLGTDPRTNPRVPRPPTAAQDGGRPRPPRRRPVQGPAAAALRARRPWGSAEESSRVRGWALLLSWVGLPAEQPAFLMDSVVCFPKSLVRCRSSATPRSRPSAFASTAAPPGRPL